MGATLPLTLDVRSTATIGPLKFTLALVPAGKMIAWEHGLGEAYGPIGKAGDDLEARIAASREAAPALAAIYSDVVRWGVAGWEGAEPPHDTATFDGATFTVLAPRAVDIITHVRGGALLSELAGEVLKANRLTEDDLLGFR